MGSIFVAAAVLAAAGCRGGDTAGGGSLGMRAVWQRRGPAGGGAQVASDECSPGGGFGAGIPPAARSIRVVFESDSGFRCCVAFDREEVLQERRVLLGGLPEGPGVATISGFPSEAVPAGGEAETCSVQLVRARACTGRFQTPSFRSDPQPVTIVLGQRPESRCVPVFAVPFLLTETLRPDPEGATDDPLVAFTVVDAGALIDEDDVSVAIRHPGSAQGTVLELDSTSCADGGEVPCTEMSVLEVSGRRVTGEPTEPLTAGGAFVDIAAVDTDGRRLELSYPFTLLPSPTPEATATFTASPTATPTDSPTVTPTATPVQRASEFQVNTYTLGSEEAPSVAGDGRGGFVVVWERILPSKESSLGIFGQRFDPFGFPLGTEFGVSQGTVAYAPEVASDADGDFVVTWEGPAANVLARRFDSGGMPRGAELEVSQEYEYAISPSVASEADGDFVVVWSRSDGVFGRRFDSAGEARGSEFRVNTSTSGYPAAARVAAGVGGFVVTWLHGYGYDPIVLLGQRFDSAGVRLGTEFAVDGDVDLAGLDVAAESSGGFAVVWGRSLGEEIQTRLQRFASDGAETGDQVVVSAGAVSDPGVAIDSAGSALVTWNERTFEPASSEVSAQRFDGSGNRLGRPFQVNAYLTYTSTPAVTAAGGGDFVVVWASERDGYDSGVFGRRFPASCFDAARDGSESDVDCGGGICRACGDGESCSGAPDCESGLGCDAGVCR